MRHTKDDLETWRPEDLLAAVQSLEAEVADLEGRLAANEAQWISVDDQLPGERDWVMVVVQRSGYAVPDVNMGGYNPFSQEWKTRWGDQFIGHVTHWMPKPKLPQEQAAVQPGLRLG